MITDHKMIIEVPYFNFIKQYKLFKMKNKKLLNKLDIDIKVYDGIPGSTWNGGRVNRITTPEKGINISFALTNHTIDYSCDITHKILEEYHNEGNAIIIADTRVIESIREDYPKYKIIYSITGFDISKGFDKYKDIENTCDFIVPRTEIVNDLKFKKEFSTKQYIMLYSYECAYCPLYNEHYKMIGEAANDPSKTYLVACWFKNKELFDKTPFVADDYDYQYITSRNFHDKLTNIKPSTLAGYKIGRNNQTWEQIEMELNEILHLIENE